MNEIKDPVKLKMFNLVEKTDAIHNTIFERDYILKWIQHQRDNVGCQFVDWEIVEL